MNIYILDLTAKSILGEWSHVLIGSRHHTGDDCDEDSWQHFASGPLIVRIYFEAAGAIHIDATSAIHIDATSAVR